MRKVNYEVMLPHEFEEALREFPVAYAAFGSLEWHGRHMALGNDTLKAQGILERTAEKYGGIVVPPTYWGHMNTYGRECCHPGLPPETVDALFTAIFRGLVVVGFKVIIGVTGHDVDEQLESLQKAAQAIQVDGAAVGFAMKEGDLYDLEADKMDHAGYWETSILMYLHPELVDLERIKDVDLTTEAGHRAAGILGRDPRTDASRALGEKFVNRIADNIGRKAQELLASLPSVPPAASAVGRPVYR
jgi:creatinine amidohydrolase